MDKTKILKRKSQDKKILINLRIEKELLKWIKDNEYSPTKIFYEAIKDLGYNQEGAKE